MLEGLFPVVRASKYIFDSNPDFEESEYWQLYSVLHMKQAMIGRTSSSGNLGCVTSKVCIHRQSESKLEELGTIEFCSTHCELIDHDSHGPL